MLEKPPLSVIIPFVLWQHTFAEPLLRRSFSGDEPQVKFNHKFIYTTDWPVKTNHKPLSTNLLVLPAVRIVYSYASGILTVCPESRPPAVLHNFVAGDALILKNKPNLQNGKMNTSPFNTVNYTCPPKPWRRRKQTQPNPILSAVALAKEEAPLKGQVLECKIGNYGKI